MSQKRIADLHGWIEYNNKTIWSDARVDAEKSAESKMDIEYGDKWNRQDWFLLSIYFGYVIDFIEEKFNLTEKTTKP